MITETGQRATIRPQRRIGEFTAMVVIEENGTDSLEITKHPVQEGAVIADNAYVKPADVTVKALFDDETMPLDELYTKLREFQALREPFDVVTGKRIYRDMLCKTLAQNTDRETENVLSLTFTLEQIIIVQVEITTVPPRSKQKSPGSTGATQKAGSKSAQEDKKPKRQQSILASARR